MKTLFIILILGIGYSQNETGNATVRKVQGVEIYIYSEPTKEYQVIESGKVLATLSGSCNEVVNQAAKKAAKVQADAVLIDLSTSKWEAVKFE